MPDASPASCGGAAEIAVPSVGMNASDIPSAATRDAGSTSTAYDPPADDGSTNESHPIPAASSASPDTVAAFGPTAASTRGARTTIPIMINAVIGSNAAPEGNAV